MNDNSRCGVEQSNFGIIKARKRKQTLCVRSHHEENEFCSPSHQVPTERGAGKKKQILERSSNACSSEIQISEHGYQRHERSDGTSHIKESSGPSTTVEISKGVETSAELRNNVELPELNSTVKLRAVSNIVDLPELTISNNVKLHEFKTELETTHGVSTSLEIPKISTAVHRVSNDIVVPQSEFLFKIEPVDEPIELGTSLSYELGNSLIGTTELSMKVEPIDDSEIQQEYEFVDCMKIKVEPSDVIEQDLEQETMDQPSFVNHLVQQNVGENSVSVQMSQTKNLEEIFTFKRIEKKLDSSVPTNQVEAWFRPCKCKTVFYSIAEFKNHRCQNVVVASEIEDRKCKVCSSIFRTEAGLKCHMRMKNHDEQAKYNEFYDHMCMYHVKFNDLEEKRIISLSLLIEVVENNPKLVTCYTCLECNSFVRKEDMLHLHLKSLHGSVGGNDVLRCKLCLKCHVDVKKMESHLKEVHEEHWYHMVDENVMYRCIRCAKLFLMNLKYPNESVNLKHITVTKRAHELTRFMYRIIPPISDDHFSRNYSCSLCGPGTYFNTEQQLNLHLKSTHMDYVYRTCSCNEKCFNMMEFYQHSKEVCKNDELNFEKFQVNSVENAKCDKCSINFENNCSLKIHELVYHDLKTLKNPKLVNGKYLCFICNVKFSTEKLLNAHVPYSVFYSKPNIFKSIAKCSILSKPQNLSHQCKICNFSTGLQPEFENHMWNDHYAQLMFCTHCNSNVSIKPNFTITHFKICNRPSLKEDRFFGCPICGLRFETFHILVNHIVIDMLTLPKKKFQCKHCLNYFFTEYNLCSHLLSGNCQCNLKIL